MECLETCRTWEYMEPRIEKFMDNVLDLDLFDYPQRRPTLGDVEQFAGV